MEKKMFNQNVQHLVQQLRAEFKEKTKKLGNKNERGTELHRIQTEYSYIINDIQQGPALFIPKLVTDFNKLIKQIE